MLVMRCQSAVRLLALCVLTSITALAAAQEEAGDDQPQEEAAPAFSVGLDKRITDGRVHYQVEVETEQRVDPDRTHIIAHIENSLGHSLIRSLERQSQHQWQLDFTPQRRARYRIDLEVSGRGLDGERFRHSLTSQYIDFPEAGDPFSMPEERKIAAIDAQLQAMKEGRASDGEGALSYTPSGASTAGSVDSNQSRRFEFEGNLALYIAVILANAIVMALLGFGFWILKNNADMDERRAKFQKQAEERDEVPAQPTMQDLTSSSASSPVSPSSTPDSPEKMPMDDGSGAPGRYDEKPSMDAMGGVSDISGSKDD